MILDGKNIGLGMVVITDSHMTSSYDVVTPTKCVDIYNKNHEYRFTFWTTQEYEKFNELPLNERIDVLDFIDDYDIDFGTKEYTTINSRENSKVYFTRIDTNIYKINVEIEDFDKGVFGNTKGFKNLKIEAIIDFNKSKYESTDYM